MSLSTSLRRFYCSGTDHSPGDVFFIQFFTSVLLQWYRPLAWWRLLYPVLYVGFTAVVPTTRLVMSSLSSSLRRFYCSGTDHSPGDVFFIQFFTSVLLQWYRPFAWWCLLYPVLYAGFTAVVPTTRLVTSSLSSSLRRFYCSGTDHSPGDVFFIQFFTPVLLQWYRPFAWWCLLYPVLYAGFTAVVPTSRLVTSSSSGLFVPRCPLLCGEMARTCVTVEFSSNSN